MKRLICLLLALLLCGCSVSVNAAMANDSRALPVLMYHSVLKDPARTGKYILSPEAFESDLVWLLQNGYTTVSLRELADFASGRASLPDKPVLLTFDDGYYNNFTYVLPLLEKYDCCAVISIVGEYAARYTDAPDPNPNYAYLGRDDITALALSGRVEFANHSYAMHGQGTRMGSRRSPGESAESYARAFTADARQCQELLAAALGSAPIAYAYPFGVIEAGSRDLLIALGMRLSFTCYESVSVITRGDPLSLFGLGRFNRPGDVSSEAFFRSMALLP